jgi:hypothetical protein
LFAKTAINHINDSIDRKRRFGNVCRHNNLSTTIKNTFTKQIFDLFFLIPFALQGPRERADAERDEKSLVVVLA